MRSLLDQVMRRRAHGLGIQMETVLEGLGSFADIGSGTGHNGEMLRARGLRVEEFDVVDMHWVGPGPELFDGLSLARADDSVDVAALVFVLQYATDPLQLLLEARRIAEQRVIVLQSSFQGAFGRLILGIREFFWGPVALAVARRFGLVEQFESSLVTRRHYTRSDLTDLFAKAGLAVERCDPDPWTGTGVSRDLYVLRPSEGHRSRRAQTRPGQRAPTRNVAV